MIIMRSSVYVIWCKTILCILSDIVIFFATAAAKLIVSIICTQLNLGHLATCSWKPVVISLNCLLLNMNSTNKTLLFDRFLIMYNLCVFTCIIVIVVFHCTHVWMSYVLNSYLLTYFYRLLEDGRHVDLLQLSQLSFSAVSMPVVVR